MRNSALKRLVSLAAAVMLAFSCVLSVSAFGSTYYLTEINDMKITLPDGMTAVKRGADSNDRYFSLFGIDYNDLMQKFSAGNIYLQGMDSAASTTVTVAMSEDENTKAIGNYNLLQSKELGEFARTFLQEATYTACTVDEAGKPVTWLYFNAKTAAGDGKAVNVFQGVTVYDGKSISVTYQRNGASVTAADYDAFKTMLESVAFGQTDFFAGFMPVILLAALVVLVIVIIILIIVIVKHAKSRRSKTDNDKILRELAGKYGRSSAHDRTSARREEYPEPEPEYEAEYEPVYEDDKPQAAQPDRDDYNYGDREYSDADIDELLGETEEPRDFQQALLSPGEEQEEVKDDTIAEDDSISEFFDDGEDVPEAIEETEAFEEENGEAIPVTEPERESEAEENIGTEPVGEAHEEISGTEPVGEAHEEIPGTQPAQEENSNLKPEEAAEEAPGDGEEQEPEPDGDGEHTDEEEYFNDEVLVRNEVRRNKFKDSNDFFDEAPKKVIGVISSKDIAEAEEYDVIGEEEKKATEVEREAPKPGEKVINGFKRFGSGLKSFGVHCGYFATNVRREIQRSRAKKKRKKAEEERRRRARERAERQNSRRDSSGLVQVRSRGQRPDQKRPPQGKKPLQGKRPPQGKKPLQGKKPSQGKRPVQSGAKTRRPAQKRPSQNRRPDDVRRKR